MVLLWGATKNDDIAITIMINILFAGMPMIIWSVAWCIRKIIGLFKKH